eukprot:scaffold23541_cov58-Cyclotella_meneghiniana.AAC.1
MVNLLKIDSRKIGRETPPLQITELYSAQGKRAIYTQGPKKKKAYIDHILDPYLTRTYLNTKKLANIISDLNKLSEDEIFNIAKNRGAMMRYMYVEGGIQTQYAPISSPVNLQHKDIKPPNKEEAKTNDFENVPPGVFDDDYDEMDETKQGEIEKIDTKIMGKQEQSLQKENTKEVPETP